MDKIKKGKIYLIPSFLGEEGTVESIAPETLSIIYGLKEFIVENEKTARAFLKKIKTPVPQSSFVLHLLNEHTPAKEVPEFLENLKNGTDIGVISEAGLPCVADPGAEVVKLAHKKTIRVVPMTGPSSIMLALMASGFNGQNFAFLGYLPIDKTPKLKKIKEIERDLRQKNQTQIFIETPYRNNHLIKDLASALSPDTMLCVAANLTQPDEIIICKKISEWKKEAPDFHKKPAVFLIGQ